MEYHVKHEIYRGMIQFILDHTHYNFKTIAHFSNSSLKTIKQLYFSDKYPASFDEELELVKLFQIILEISQENRRTPLFCQRKKTLA